MTERTPSASGDNLRKRHQARKLLAKLDIHEPLARRAETATTEYWRARHADHYRRLLGISPADRGQLREALVPIAEHGGRSVDEVIGDVAGAHHENGLPPDEGA